LLLGKVKIGGFNAYGHACKSSDLLMSCFENLVSV
jgi:hypothetical protein